MSSTPKLRPLTLTQASQLSPQQMVDLSGTWTQQIEALTHRLDWFQRQIFGQKSERHLLDNPQQMSLGEIAAPVVEAPAPTRPVAAHGRRIAAPASAADESGLFFDETRVPIQIIQIPNPDCDGLRPDQFEIISTKYSHRLAQRPGSYVVLRYVRTVIKRHDSPAITCPSLPDNVIQGSRADVSLIAGIIVDKCSYHLPLYRQHQRMGDAGIRVSRPWLTQLVQKGAKLLEPIYLAQLASICTSRVIAMDETPIKAGRDGPGKMKKAYFWPVYGEHDEVCFPFFPNRQAVNVEKVLGLSPGSRAVLLSDGYAAYSHYAKKTGLTHAQCWTHARREFFEAHASDPAAADQALTLIRAIYAVEQAIRDQALGGEEKREYRLTHAKPIVETFFAWVSEQLHHHGLLPNTPFTRALAYAHERRLCLEVFLTDPDVPTDTNHLERALRAIPMGRKNWLFSWTEVGAKHIGILQSLIVTCRLHSIDPYDYFVDVLQRVGQHPASEVQQLTPRLWKEHFAQNPLRSDVRRFAA